jgi:hypothetical protein
MAKKDETMTTPRYCDLAAQLLRDAASFFRSLAEQNALFKDQMIENADVFEQVAGLVSQNPKADIEGKTIAQIAAQLLRDAATFFTSLSKQNEALKDQMTENAAVFLEVAVLVERDPLGILGIEKHVSP